MTRSLTGANSDSMAEDARGDWPSPFEMMKLQARPADGGDWVDIYPAQLEQMVRNGADVRALEVARAAPVPQWDAVTAGLSKPETMLTYASILEKPQYWVDQRGQKWLLATGEIIEAACAALRYCAALAGREETRKAHEAFDRMLRANVIEECAKVAEFRFAGTNLNNIGKLVADSIRALSHPDAQIEAIAK